MPCACKTPAIVVPSADQWGPLIWRILHSLAERAGRHTSPLLQADEVRAWTVVLKALQKGLPCETCREHYVEYFEADTPVLPEAYPALREYVRRWLWELHNNVNGRLGKPVFAWEDLSATYKDTNILYTIKQLQALGKTSVIGGSVSILSFKALTAAFLILQGCIG
jgi:Erv1 / Alr family